MPETSTLDLSAEDVTEAQWDQLTRRMLDGEESQELPLSFSSSVCTDGKCVCSGCTGCSCGGCGGTQIHP
jgi:hypothetical protein